METTAMPAAPREAIGPALCEIARDDPRLIVLDADLARSTSLDVFEREFPDRFVQLGVAEQNAIGVATGLAYAGLHPVFASMAMFSLALPWTQLRQACYAGVGLTVIGTHPGVDVGPDGGTHQSFEDLALARVIPGMVVLTPCDRPETAAALRWAVGHPGPVYVRVGRHPVPDLHVGPVDFVPGQAEVLARHGNAVLLVADGSMAACAARVAESVAGVALAVRSVKPLDTETLRREAVRCGQVLSVENHSVLGGLGSAVCEALGDLPDVTVHRLGVPDRFGFSASSTDLLCAFGLDDEHVLAVARELVCVT